MKPDLRALYAEIPTLECKLLCQASCRDVPLLPAERDQLRLPMAMDVCPKLGAFGQCTIHDDRPLMCRLWGVVENMPCPHGCRPTRMLSMAEGRAIVNAAERLGGTWDSASPDPAG